MQTTDITKSYFATTSSQSSAPDAARYVTVEGGLRRRLGSWIPGPGQAVLDLGCGLGDLLYLAHRQGAGPPLVGVNLCAEENTLAALHVPAEFHCRDIVEYLRDETRIFDWIGCMNILEHLTKDRVVKTLELTRKRLNPGGVLVAMVPNAISPFSSTTRHWDFTHEWAFAPNNFRQLARLCGYAEPEFRECGPVPHGMVSGVRWVGWQMIRLAIKAWLLVETANTKDAVYSMDMLVRLRSVHHNVASP